MKKSVFLNNFLFLFLFILSGVFSSSAQTKKYSEEIEKRIKEVENNLASWVKIEGTPSWTLDDKMKFYHANGVSIAVINNYKIEWVKGYGLADSSEQKPVTPATLFEAGSVSKSLNSLGVLKLVEAGKLELGADINDYLQSWKFPYDSLSKGKKITIAHLLSHTAGINVHGFYGYERGDTIPTLVQILNGEKPANSVPIKSQFEPGLRFDYSGGGTMISQLIIQDVTGQPYDKFMRDSILKPLGMDNSSFAQPPLPEKLDLLATGYYNDGKPVKGKYYIYPQQAAGGLWTTPTDIAKYIVETQLSLLGRSNKILTKKMTKRRLTPYIDTAVALGVFITNKKGARYFGHGGDVEGFVSQYYGSMENGKGVVVMANTYNSALLDEIINSVASVYHWTNFYTPVIKREITLSEKLLDSYAGKYKYGNNNLVIIRKEDGLWLDVNGATQFKMHFSDNSNFFVFEVQADLKFFFDDTEKVIGFTINNQKANKIE